MNPWLTQDQAAPAVPAGSMAVQVQRHQGARVQAAEDRVITEVPVALVYNGLSHAVMMATPVQLVDFALGFSLSEGLIGSVDDVRDVARMDTPDGIELQMHVSPRAFEALKARRRTLAGRTGCGLCGLESLSALRESEPAPLPAAVQAAGAQVQPAAVLRALDALQAMQVLQAETGGCHAAAWATPDGQLQHWREDVGRHNALDKLIGALAAEQGLGEPGFVVVSSRASHELVSKCVRMGLGTLASISAPTSMAIAMARRSGLRLLGFCRDERAVDYSGIGADAVPEAVSASQSITP
jgi:FdhD protein